MIKEKTFMNYLEDFKYTQVDKIFNSNNTKIVLSELTFICVP